MPLTLNGTVDEPDAAGPSLDTKTWSEERLVTAAQQGSREALDELLAHYRSVVFGILRRYTLNHDEAEDLVQEVMLRVCRNIAQFRSQSRFSSWLVAIAINVAISSKRKARRAQWIYLDEPGQSGDPPSAYLLVDRRKTPEQSCLCNERINQLTCGVRRLHPRYRSVFVRTYIDGVPIEATAHALGLTLGAAKSRLHRARRMLSVSFERNVKKTQGGLRPAGRGQEAK